MEADLRILQTQIAKVTSYLRSEFGGTDELGNHSEGNVNRNFREARTELKEIKERVKMQNGKVAAIEGALGKISTEKLLYENNVKNLYRSITVLQGFVLSLVIALIVEVLQKR